MLPSSPSNAGTGGEVWTIRKNCVCLSETVQTQTLEQEGGQLVIYDPCGCGVELLHPPHFQLRLQACSSNCPVKLLLQPTGALEITINHPLQHPKQLGRGFSKVQACLSELTKGVCTAFDIGYVFRPFRVKWLLPIDFLKQVPGLRGTMIDYSD
jgi:hypothetical protein